MAVFQYLLFRTLELFCKVLEKKRPLVFCSKIKSLEFCLYQHIYILNLLIDPGDGILMTEVLPVWGIGRVWQDSCLPRAPAWGEAAFPPARKRQQIPVEIPHSSSDSLILLLSPLQLMHKRQECSHMMNKNASCVQGWLYGPVT